MNLTRNRSDGGGGRRGCQLLGFDDSLAAVRLARQELAERSWRPENDAQALDERKTIDSRAISVSKRPTTR
jgi:hypothetical protein